MMDYKTAIIPVVAVVCLGIATVTGHAISASLQDTISADVAALVGVGLSVWGIFKNHKKEGTK